MAPERLKGSATYVQTTFLVLFELAYRQPLTVAFLLFALFALFALFSLLQTATGLKPTFGPLV